MDLENARVWLRSFRTGDRRGGLWTGPVMAEQARLKLFIAHVNWKRTSGARRKLGSFTERLASDGSGRSG